MAGLGRCGARGQAGPRVEGDCRTLLQRRSRSKRINDTIDFGPGRW